MMTTLSGAAEYRIIYAKEEQRPYVEHLQTLARTHNVALTLQPEKTTAKLNQRHRQALSSTDTQPILIFDDKNKLSLLSKGLSVALEWDKLQRRVVSAGRKSELLLQAAKITADSVVVDATAGFGHDSLILASSGAQVIMLEQQPIMALLLLAEQQRMSQVPNWQKLMARLHIMNTDALSYFTDKQAVNTEHIDTIYLDPMFPEDSYQDQNTGKGAKVGKQMQALHHIARPPTLAQEEQLLFRAKEVIAKGAQTGRVIVKRPKLAPFLAQQSPDESWQNAALRFDGYFI